MKKYTFIINGNSYETEVIDFDENIAEIEVNGSHYKVEIVKGVKAKPKTPKLIRPISVPSTDEHPSISKTAKPTEPKGVGVIKSPLPGVVIDVFVKIGDTVVLGQKLLMLEAMKMENNIESDKSGKILSIEKNKGDSVMEGDILITIG